jgi:glycosyltransferase involved in cell wall biosynthesis
MRVTFVHPSHTLRPGGGARVVYEYANYMVRQGHTVNLVFPCRLDAVTGSLRIWAHHARNWRDWLTALGSATIRRRMGQSAMRWIYVDPAVRLFFVPALDLQRIPEADAIFATFWRTAEYVLEYPLSKGEKFYLVQEYETWAGPKDRVDRTWLAPLHKVVVSRWLYDIGTAMGATRIRHITNAIDHRQFEITRPNEPRRLALLSMYSTQKWKGAADAIAVFQKIRDRYPHIDATMFGIEKRNREIPEWVQYVRNPSPDRLRDLYNSHSIYVGASWHEGWGLPPAEAMACGCAFVGTDIGGFREFAIDGRTALLSPPRDRDAMFRNLRSVIDDPNLLSRLRTTGNEHIRKFTWEKSGALLERYLDEIVGARTASLRLAN